MRFPVKSYPVYLLTGLIFWNFFSQTTLSAANTLVWGSGLLKRIYIPRTIFAVSVMGNGLFNFVISLIPLAIVMLVLGHPFYPTILLIPIPILFAAMFTLGMGLLVSAVAVFFTDVVDLYGIILPAWFYLTPIVYPIDLVSPRIAVYLRWNPMYLLLEQFRSLIYYGQIPSWQSIVVAAVLSSVTMIVGWLVFTKRVDELAYRI
jgi:ABC-2 type transport system permease protein